MATVREALTTINKSCDGAISLDGIGFNGRDTGFAKTLLAKTYWTPRMELAAHKLLKKYHKQLSGHGIDYDTLELVEQSPQPEERKFHLAFNPGRNLFFLYSTFSEKDLAKSLPGPYWNPEAKNWSYKPTIAFMEKALELKSSFTEIEDEARNKLNELYKESKLNPTEPQQSDNSAAGAEENLSEIKSYIKSSYFPHQRLAFEALISHPYFALFPEQRVGKTFPTIGAIGYRADINGVKRVLIVAPKTVTYEWQEKLVEEADFPVEVYLLDDTLDKRRELLKETNNTPTKAVQIALINYDCIKRLEADLIKWKPEMVILDEAHHIKNGRSQQSKAASAIGRKARFRAILTGTPVPEGPLDIWAQYRFLSPEVFGKSYIRFRDRYAVMGGYMGRNVIGIRTIPTIQGKPNRYYDEELSKEYTKKVYDIATRITLKEVNNSPDPKIISQYVDMEPEARQLYSKLKKEALLELDGGRISTPLVITKLLRLQQICGGFIRPDEEGDYQQVSWAKLNALEEYITNTKSKMVIFAKFTKEIEAIQKLAEKHNIPHHVLTGKTKNRGFIRQDFQKNPNTRLFISQIGTGGEGITLSAADITIFYSTGVSLREYDQALSRIKNLTKTSQLTYIHILVRNSRDVEIAEALDRKQDISRMSVDKLRELLFKEENTMPLPKEVTRLLEHQPKSSGGARFDSEVSELLDEIEKDLENYGKLERDHKRTMDEFLEEQRNKKKAEEDKKTAKQESKGKSKKKKVEQQQAKAGGIITLQDLGEELKLEPKDMRKVLRAKFSKPESGRWEWDKDDPELAKIKSALKGH